MAISKYVMVAKIPQLNGNIKLFCLCMCGAINYFIFLILYLYPTYKLKYLKKNKHLIIDKKKKGLEQLSIL